jgi:hypothetical protein
MHNNNRGITTRIIFIIIINIIITIMVSLRLTGYLPLVHLKQELSLLLLTLQQIQQVMMGLMEAA